MRDLETAENVGDVLCLARGYVDSLQGERLEHVPDRCRGRELHGADDVRWWSQRLSEEYWRRRNLGRDAGDIQDLWSFFLRASIQTRRLATRTFTTPG